MDSINADVPAVDASGASLPRVAIIVLNWNGLEDTLACLESLDRVAYRPLDVVVVDNASRGADADRFEAEWGDRVRVLRSPRNLGFAGGNNLGIRFALDELGADHVLLLNNDTVVDAGFVDALVDAARRHPEAGVLASKMFYHSDPEVLWYAGGWYRMFGHHGHEGFGLRDDGRFDRERDTGFAPFASVLVTGEAVRRVGLMSEAYFLQWEDLDYCVRVERAGLKVRFVPSSVIWHKVGRSSGRGAWAYRKHWHGMRGRVLFRRKHLGRGGYWAFLALFFLVYVPLLLPYYVLVRRDARLFPAAVSGAWAGATGAVPAEATGGSGRE